MYSIVLFMVETSLSGLSGSGPMPTAAEDTPGKSYEALLARADDPD